MKVLSKKIIVRNNLDLAYIEGVSLVLMKKKEKQLMK
jgi:hypothetical protein